MELQHAVNKKIFSLKIQEKYPLQYLYDIRQDLMEMYVVGWEQGRLEVNQHTNKAIAQYDQHGSIVCTYKSLKEAARITGFSEKGIVKCMQRGTPMKQGWMWKYVEKKEDKPKHQNALLQP